jgi:S-adenosylmethionine:tRNA ribosyltransferase-isomerase
MKLSDFDFDLPDRLIALRPVKPRPASRMLVARGDETYDSHVRDLPDWLRPGDIPAAPVLMDRGWRGSRSP